MIKELHWVEAAIVAALVLTLAAVGLMVYSDYKRPTIEIKKDDWDCVKSEQRTHLQPMYNGTSTILMPITNTVCVEYRRHAD